MNGYREVTLNVSMTYLEPLINEDSLIPGILGFTLFTSSKSLGRDADFLEVDSYFSVITSLAEIDEDLV